MRCLIIEPNQTLSAGLADAIEDLGHSALIAGSSAEAKSRLRMGNYDVVMLAHEFSPTRATELIRMCRATNPAAHTLRLTGCEVTSDGRNTQLAPHIVRMLAGPDAGNPTSSRSISSAISWLS